MSRPTDGSKIITVAGNLGNRFLTIPPTVLARADEGIE
jgi:hypothetical protein